MVVRYPDSSSPEWNQSISCVEFPAPAYDSLRHALGRSAVHSAIHSREAGRRCLPWAGPGLRISAYIIIEKRLRAARAETAKRATRLRTFIVGQRYKLRHSYCVIVQLSGRITLSNVLYDDTLLFMEPWLSAVSRDTPG